MNERRQDVRYQLALDRRVAIRQSDGSIVYARASDISLGGIGIKCEYAADAGRLFLLHFRLPVQGESRDVRVHCRVMFCHFSGADGLFRLGLRFERFEADGEEVVSRHVEERLAQSKGGLQRL